MVEGERRLNGPARDELQVLKLNEAEITWRRKPLRMSKECDSSSQVVSACMKIG